MGINLINRGTALATLVLIAVMVAAILILREPMEAFTRQRLDEARKSWEQAGFLDYNMSLEMAGNAYRVEVRGGMVRRLTQNGRTTTTHRPQDFSVTGLFDTLERELEIRDDPRNAFGGEPANTILRARFHPKLGYPERYLRVVGGTGRSLAIYVTALSPVQNRPREPETAARAGEADPPAATHPPG